MVNIPGTRSVCHVKFFRRFKSVYSYTCRFSNAVSVAIEALPKDSEIRKFLGKNRAEVTGMCLKEYDEERAKRLFKQEGFEEGLVLGRQEGEKRGEKKFSSLMAKLLSVGKMDDMKRVIEDEEYRERLYKEYGITGSNE